MKMLKSDSIYLEELPPPPPVVLKPTESSTISWKDTHYQPPRVYVRETAQKAQSLPLTNRC